MLLGLVVTAIWQRDRIAAIVENWDAIREGAEQAPAADSADALAESIRAHPQKVALATWSPGREDEAVLHRADEVVGIASTVKILILAEYARQVADGRLDPEAEVPLANWEVHLLPGTDGGAHTRAVEALREAGALKGDVARVRELAQAMIVHSDNAATDWLLHRLGREAVSSTSAWLGVNEPAPAPLGGALLLARTPPSDLLPAQWMEQLLILEPEERLDRSWELSSKLAQDPAFAAEQRASFEEVGIGLNFTEQMQSAKTLAPRGTARGYAQVMAKVLTKEPGEAWAELMTGLLDWPLLRSAQLRDLPALRHQGRLLPGSSPPATSRCRKTASRACSRCSSRTCPWRCGRT